MYRSETSIQGMETCGSDINGECLVTDIVHELSTGLEIPFLLENGIKSVTKTENVSILDNMLLKEPIQEYWGDDPYFNIGTERDNLFDLKEENNDLESFIKKNSITQAPSTYFSGSGSGSGSECSSTELWPTKIELDTPPITPPDERISPDNVFLLQSDELKFIPICTEENLHKKSKAENDYTQVNNKVRLQPKPVSTTLNIFETQPVDVQTVTFNVYNHTNSSNLNSVDLLDPNSFLNSYSGKKKSLLTKKDLELLQAKRKQERMIRNRESAYLSRKRKKEHVAHLEKQVQDLQAENKHLRLENCSLRRRLGKYEKLEQPSDKKAGNLLTESPRKTTALLALLFTVCLNVGSFSSLLNEKRVFKNDIDVVSEDIVPNYPSELRHSRSLLWAGNELGSLNSSYANLTKTSCSLLVNQTESIRLESELRRWIGGDEDYSRQTKYNLSKISQYFYLGERPSHRKNVSKRKQRVLKSNFQKKNLEINMYQMNLLNFNTFFEAIHRRDDTFYLVSFSSDHLLLPALSHNQTSRPKMSLMLPAFLSNGTGAVGVEMMQIDCEVTNTQLLSVNENDIPSHMRPYSNSTSRTKSKTETNAKGFDEYFVNDLPISLVPAKNITFEAEKVSHINSSGIKLSEVFAQITRNNISNSSDIDDLNFENSPTNLTQSESYEIEGSRSYYAQFKKKTDIFSNESYNHYQNAVELFSSSAKSFFKLLRLGLGEGNSKAAKFNAEKGLYKSHNATRFLFN